MELRGVAGIAALAQGSYKSLQAKQDLLQILVDNERARLRVWLFPLDPERKHHMPTIGGKTPAEVCSPSLSRICIRLTHIHRALYPSFDWPGPKVRGWLSRWLLVSRRPRCKAMSDG